MPSADVCRWLQMCNQTCTVFHCLTNLLMLESKYICICITGWECEVFCCEDTGVPRLLWLDDGLLVAEPRWSQPGAKHRWLAGSQTCYTISPLCIYTWVFLCDSFTFIRGTPPLRPCFMTKSWFRDFYSPVETFFLKKHLNAFEWGTALELLLCIVQQPCFSKRCRGWP